MSDLSGALCVGKGPLFESTYPTDHAEASQLCGAGTEDECPAFAACGGMARGLQRGPVTDRPVGTWAGVLYGGPEQQPEGKVRRRCGPKPLPREHGTDRGYYQHLSRREPACSDCKDAHKVHVWLRAQACGERVVALSKVSDNGDRETTKASRPRAIGAPTPARGLADRLETTDSCTW